MLCPECKHDLQDTQVKNYLHCSNCLNSFYRSKNGKLQRTTFDTWEKIGVLIDE